MITFLLISFPSCDLNRELAFAIPPVTAQAMPSCGCIAHVFLADDIAIFDFYHCHSTHFPRPLIAPQCFAPATNALLNFSLADRRSSQLIYGQSRHSIATAIHCLLLFFSSPCQSNTQRHQAIAAQYGANHRLDFSFPVVA